LMIDTQQKKYVAFLRGPSGNRLYSTSDDFVRWSPLAESMDRAPGKSHAPIYTHVAFNYGQHYLGFASPYAIENSGIHHLRLRLLSSRDGLHFKFSGPDPYQRPALIEVGDYGDWDRFMVMMTGGPPIQFGDKLFIYYRGFSETHNRNGVKPKDSYYAGANGLATLRLDGFASLASGYEGGTITTTPFVFDGETLTINAKSNHHGSSIVTEVLDEKGQPIPHFTAADNLPMTKDAVATPIGWKDRKTLKPLAGQTIRLRFRLTNARLYSYRVV